MGLDTTHGCWSGPYSSFSRWREAVQVAAGWHLEERNDAGFHFRSAREVNWDAVTEDNIEGNWDPIPEDPLVVLAAHSDCDGELPVPVLIPLAERLEELAARMGATDGQKPDDWLTAYGHASRPARADYDGERNATLRFAAGLREAAAANEPVEFH